MTDIHQYFHSWREPLELLPSIAEQQADDDALVFLHSALRTSYSGRYSWLGIGLNEQFECDDIDEFSAKVSQGQRGSPLDRWFGYLSYELAHSQEGVLLTKSSYIKLPKLWLGKFKHVYCFDHDNQVVTEYSRNPRHAELVSADSIEGKIHKNSATVDNVSSNMAKDEYISIVQKTLDEIHAGNFYQANITRKFFGEFATGGKLNEPQLFVELCKQSPAPYAAYMRIGDKHVLSSSPELFLQIDETGQMLTRPIKGTLGRFQGKASDLANSKKDQSENLMIVDLMRNDFSRVAKPSSVSVDDLFSIDSFSTLHHMSSNVRAELADGLGVADAVKAIFPAGSMTGAPKIAAMKWCATQENIDRGIYSGAIGWCDANQCEFSVVIRTLLLHGNRFEFQVGGGIVADSNPESEWQETIVKAHGILRAMGLSAGDLREL